MSSKHEVGQIIFNLLVNNQYCPFRANAKVNIVPLYRLACVNKAEHLLLHFLTCEYCRSLLDEQAIKTLEQLRFRLHILPLIFEGERRRFERVLKKCRTHAILFKQFEIRIRMGNDMDVLVPKMDLGAIAEEGVRQGYKKTERVRHKEIQLTNSAHHFKVDVHHLLAFPLYGEFSDQEFEMMRRYSADLLKIAKGRRCGFVQIPIEWYLVSRVLHYWYNDLLCGIYPLYEISTFFYKYRETIDWAKLCTIADSYSIRNEILCILSIANNLLGIALPEEIKKSIPLRILMVSSAITLDDIMYFPPISLWYHKRYRAVAETKYRRYSFIKLLVNQDVSITRLIRIRIIFFLLLLYIRYGWKKVKRHY